MPHPLQEIRTLVQQAQSIDAFAHRGALAVSAQAGKVRVERVVYDDAGVSTVFACSDFVPLNLLALNLNAEARFGAGEMVRQ